ncbi:hypothetical protein N799_02080 [Lysobacter arseniciresistens ZS79]|uniref:YecA family protein n=1 Tax=Lysobacter arseniciresistens ZS79 TaxID=913325 RepID=A0A0A0F2D0_9GAMM|nr:UPF0149 family protein [Lysobacter arseniciresistens]KGM56705.1 hypothetical protein N799_02080 [Lysobacter arseniciresistens ZS79]
MTKPTHLDDAQIERLADLLEQRAVPFKGFNLEALDGYLSALAVSPGEALPMSAWEPDVWGKPPRWDDEAERAEVVTLLLAHHHMATARVRHGDDDLPDHLAPLLWLPEDPEEEADDELDVGRDWALGFFTAVALREAEWDRWLDDNEWIDDIFGLLDRLASGEVLAEDPTAPATPISYRERLEIIAGLPDMLADLHHHRIDALTPREPIRRDATPDRNDPCPCGSGKKYKKCCGAS